MDTIKKRVREEEEDKDDGEEEDEEEQKPMNKKSKKKKRKIQSNLESHSHQENITFSKQNNHSTKNSSELMNDLKYIRQNVLGTYRQNLNIQEYALRLVEALQTEEKQLKTILLKLNDAGKMGNMGNHLHNHSSRNLSNHLNNKKE